MQSFKSFLPAFLLVVIPFLSPSSTADMIVNYNSGIMKPVYEVSSTENSSDNIDTAYFADDHLELDVTFSIPDVELATGAQQYFLFTDLDISLVVSKTASNIFDTFTLRTDSYFYLALSPDNQDQHWELSFWLIESNNPADGVYRTARFSSFGQLTSAKNGYEIGGGLNMYQQHWQTEFNGIMQPIDTTVYFDTDLPNSKITIRRAIPEPQAIALLCSGLILLVAVRRRNRQQ